MINTNNLQKMPGLYSRMVSKEEKKFKSSNFVHVNKVSSSHGKKLRTNSGTPVKKSMPCYLVDFM